MTAIPRQAVTPVGLNHIVLNVHDVDESHAFWTEILGFKQVGELKPRPDRPNPPRMRFYSYDHGDGRMSHHDLALVENANLPSREAWLEQLAFMQSRSVKFDRRVEHGMTHSLYVHDPNGYGNQIFSELPRDVWSGDIDGALNWSIALPTEGQEALADRTEGLPVFS
jgi:catechol-2,3-dioxygenase